MSSTRIASLLLAMGIALTCGLSPMSAQELEPRAYRPLPIGLHFGLLVYSLSVGNVVVDPTTPVEGLELGLTVSAPTGNYKSERVVNAGANRWGFKPEIGTTVQRGRWINEIALGVW